jgi:D-hexose-6-phosphate mutarotase
MNQALPETITKVIGRGGLDAFELTNQFGFLRVMQYGAHVTDWVPKGHQPVIWISRKSDFKVGLPIRGGSPVCFPWFGQPDPEKPLHGLLRTRMWNVSGATQLPNGATQLTFCSISQPEDHVQFSFTYQLTLGRELERSLYIWNSGASNLRYEMMLHDYFAVSSIRSVSVIGLLGLVYADKTDGSSFRTQVAEPLTFSGETDRVYFQPKDCGCALIDKGMGRKIKIVSRGCNSLAVWNPWDQKAARMPDFGDDEWHEMVCLESGRALNNFGNIRPKTAHLISSYIGVEGL